MMNLENIKRKLSKIKPGTWVVIAAGVVAAIYIFYPRSSTTTTIPAGEAYSPVGSSGSSGDSGMSAGSDGTLTQIVNDTQQGFDIMQKQIDTLSDTNAKLLEQNDQLKSDYQSISTEFTNYQRNTDKQLEEVDRSFTATQTESSFDSALANLGSIYTDKDDDATQFNTIVHNVSDAKSSGDLTSSQADKVLSKIAGLGNNGAGYNPTAAKATESKIASDSSFKSSEITRTNEVIKNREKAGLDTSLQKKYLSKITGL